MVEENVQQPMYIVLSQTGSMLSKLLKKVTHAQYNHVSISLSADLQPMYSFGRRHPYNPFWGGFVLESRDTGTFKRFSNTTAAVLTVDISQAQYQAMDVLLHRMLLDKKQYHYNFIGLLFAAFHVVLKRKHHYYCSEFVRELLQTFEVEGADRLDPITQPIHFLNLPYTLIYCGRLCDYSPSNKLSEVENPLLVQS